MEEVRQIINWTSKIFFKLYFALLIIDVTALIP